MSFSSPIEMPVRTSSQWAARIIDGVLCGVLIAVALSAPWAFGAVEPWAQATLGIVTGALLIAWAVRAVLLPADRPQGVPVAVCLGGAIILAVLQLVPLPHRVLGLLSPETVQLYDELLPAAPERLRAEKGISPICVAHDWSFRLFFLQIGLIPFSSHGGAVRLNGSARTRRY